MKYRAYIFGSTWAIGEPCQPYVAEGPLPNELKATIGPACMPPEEGIVTSFETTLQQAIKAKTDGEVLTLMRPYMEPSEYKRQADRLGISTSDPP